MTISTKTISRDVEKINAELGQLNKDILQAVKNGNSTRVRELTGQVKLIKESLLDRENITRNKLDASETSPTEQVNFKLSKTWGDPRMNPYWLKLADYLGVKEKDYLNARDKLNYILDWAAEGLKTNDMGQIINKLSKVQRSMYRVNGMEREYQALYRYAKLDSAKQEAKGDVRQSIEAELEAHATAKPQQQEEQT